MLVLDGVRLWALHVGVEVACLGRFLGRDAQSAYHVRIVLGQQIDRCLHFFEVLDVQLVLLSHGVAMILGLAASFLLRLGHSWVDWVLDLCARSPHLCRDLTRVQACLFHHLLATERLLLLLVELRLIVNRHRFGQWVDTEDNLALGLHKHT